MSWNTTYQLAEQHRNDMLKSAAEARLVRTSRRSNPAHRFVARHAVQVDTFPVPVPSHDAVAA